MTEYAASRTAAGQTAIGTFAARRFVSVSSWLLLAAIVCAVLLALPGQTVATRYLNDLFLIVDHTHRIAWGDVPNRDFHTPLGPIVSYLPAAGYWLSGTFGGAMPVGMGVAILALAPAITHVLASRLQPLIALVYGVFLLLILAAPINLGESLADLSFAKFYNRIGWVALGALLILHLQPRRSLGSDWRDALCAAFLTVIMVYTKASYGLIALAFLAFELLDRRQRSWATGAIAVTLASAVVIELVWRSTSAYIADVRLALEVSGLVRGTSGQIADHILGNLADYVLFGLFAALALRRRRSFRDALFYGFCALAGFFVINQNYQSWGIITLHAGAAVAAETILRDTEDAAVLPDPQWPGATGAKLLFIALVLPAMVHSAAALGLHATAATGQAGQAIPFGRLGRIRFADLWTGGDYGTGLEYIATIEDGAAALSAINPKPECVVVLDFANPFSAILGLRPAKGDSPWLQWDRTIGPSTAPPPEMLLAGAQIVMEPKPLPQSEPETLPNGPASPPAIYTPYMAANFEAVWASERWTVHRRRTGAPRASSEGCKAPGTPASRPEARP